MTCSLSVKRLLVPVVAVLFLSSLGMAETPRHDVSLSLGIATWDQIMDVFTDLMVAVGTLGNFQKSYQTGAPVFLTYRYLPEGRLSMGAALGIYTSKGDLLLAKTEEGTFKESNIIAVGEFAYRWVKSDSLQLYSGLGAGVLFKNGTYTVTGSPDTTISYVRPTFHLNALGFRLGKNFGFFGELGLGYKGIIHVGVSGRF